MYWFLPFFFAAFIAVSAAFNSSAISALSIDREARDKAADILRHFIFGQITNFEFEEEIPSSNDPVISAIEGSMWFFYDDLTKHKMKGDWVLPKQTKEIMAK